MVALKFPWQLDERKRTDGELGTEPAPWFGDPAAMGGNSPQPPPPPRPQFTGKPVNRSLRHIAVATNDGGDDGDAARGAAEDTDRRDEDAQQPSES